MKKYKLIKSFTFYSLLAFILTGIVLSQITYGHIRDNDVTNIVEIAVVSIKSIIVNDLEKSDLDSLLSNSKKLDIEYRIDDFMSSYDIDSITIINSKEEIVMNGKSPFSFVNNQNEKYIDDVLNGHSEHAVSDIFIVNGTQNAEARRSFFNLFIPMKFGEKIEGVAIIRIPSEIVSSHARMLVQEIALALTGGLIFLFLLLIGILYRTSKTLVFQNEHLNKQKGEIANSYQKLDSSYRSTVIAMSNAVDARDSYTAGHSSRVSEISLMIGKELGLSEIDLKNLEYATLFHDIGKIGISDNILNKSGKLSDDEFDIIKNHPIIGVNILKDIDFLKDSLPLILHHHEKFGGGGYPNNLKGDDIPFGARIISIADTYDAMTSDRPYRKGMNHDLAIKEIIQNKGTQFDGRIVDAFLNIESKVKNRI